MAKKVASGKKGKKGFGILEAPVDVDAAPLEEAPVDVDILEEPADVDTTPLEEAHGRLETLATLFEYYENNPAPAPP